jgi:histone-lysine N-methyltransferase SETMAR
MRRISARFVPRLLSEDQKALRVSLCRELKQQARDDPNFISNIITGDETWVYDYDPETKQQSSQWKSPNSQRPIKARQVRSNVKSTLIYIFFSTSKELPTRNSYPLAKPSMASFTVRF